MRAAMKTVGVLGAMWVGALLTMTLQAAEPAEVTGPDLAVAVEEHIAGESKVADGAFVVRDPIHAEDVPLTLVSVHRSPVRKTGEGTYVVCADFKNVHGEALDVDFFVAGATPEDLKVTSVFVHSADGHPRYTWVEVGGTWVKQAPYEVKKK